MEQILDLAVPFLDSIPAVRAVLGFILVFFLPGFAWTFVFFKQLNIIERAALAIGLSIALVTLVIIVLDVLLHVKITGVNSLLVIIVLAIIPVVIYYLKRLLGKRSPDSTQ